ncbi:hypothetical protein Tco_1170786, partial [Tanacetum coccineum]
VASLVGVVATSQESSGRGADYWALNQPNTNSWIPWQLVSGDTNPGRHVTRDKWKGKAQRGFCPWRDTPTTFLGPHSFSQTMKCHGGGFSQATCRLG